MYKLICLFLLIPFAGLSQSYKLHGSIKDKVQNAVPYAIILVQNAEDSTKKQSTLSNENGVFVIENVPKGDYHIVITAIGFEKYNQQITLNDNSELLISMKEVVNQLNEVVVATKKPTVIRKIDRIEFKVENTILSSSNAWEIVKRAPGVQSGSDQLAIRGSQSIIVTINNKRVTLTGDELKAFLESTAGNDVSAVEVITNPPASYEASGRAVLNIRMKVNRTAGYKGLLGTGYTQGIYAKENINTSQYYKSGGLSIFGSYNFGRGSYYNEIKEVTNYTVQDQSQTWIDFLHRRNNRDAEHTYRLSLDYAIDTMNTISIGTDGYIARRNHAIYNVPTSIYNSGVLQSYFITQNTRLTPGNNTNINLDYDHRFSATAHISFSAMYSKLHNTTDQDVKTTYYMIDPHDARFVTNTAQRIHLYTAQADYSLDNKVLNIQAGAKFSRVKAANFLDFQRDSVGSLITDPLLSNIFNYQESIMAAYISANKDWGNWSIKAGLRGEYTDINSNSVNPAQVDGQGYFNLFPTVFLQNKLSSDHQLGISYGKRITRPPYNYLNPSRSYFSPNSYLVGDANLKPALTDQYSLLYTYKNKYNAEFYLIDEKHPTIQLPFQDNVTHTLIQKVTNIPGGRFYGIDLSTGLQPVTWWSVDLNPGAAFQTSRFPLSTGDFLYRKIFSVNIRCDNQFVLSKKGGFSADAGFNFNSASLQGPAQVSSVSSLNVGIRKKFFDNRAEISLSMNDIYRGMKMKITSDYADQHNYFTYYGDTQNFRVAFKYDLGNNRLKVKGEKVKTEEQKRL